MELIVARTEEFPTAAREALGRALVLAERPCLGLPTGSTPIPLYHELRETRFHFPEGTRAFALDEYCWPDATDPGTNAAFFRRHWPADDGFPSVHLPRADAADPVEEIAAHCRAIAACGGLDIALLGIGPNGHIAFNEPGSAADAGCRVVELAPETRAALEREWPEGPPTEAMTVGIREILAARRVILLATGAAKAAVLRAALTGPVTPALPASLLQGHPGLIVVCDTGAWPN